MQRDVFDRFVVLTTTRWKHILERHGDEIGDLMVFEQDMRTALVRPELVYVDRGSSYTESEMFVECSSDPEYENYVVLVAVKVAQRSQPQVASARLRPEVPPPGRHTTNVLHGSPSVYPCGSPRAGMRQRIGDRFASVFDELRSSLEAEG